MSTARRSLPTLLALTLAAAGCVAPSAADLDDAAALAPVGLPTLDPATYLFDDPENAPHPKFGWPTLTAPASGAVPAWWAPIESAELPSPIAGLAHLTSVEGITAGAGISLFGSLAIVPGYGDASWIVDITDPEAPVVLSEFEPAAGPHRGSAVIAYPDGRLVAVFATGAGFETWDITDPTAPQELAQVEPTQGGHKLGVVPGTPYVYNAASRGGGATGLTPQSAMGVTEIYDLTDPAAPRHVQDFENGFSCHHIFFWNSAEKQRAICAGIQFAQIWDTADPENPVVVTNVPMPHGDPRLPSLRARGPMPFAHFSILNQDGTVLIVGDELGGGSQPPGCTVALTQKPGPDITAPTGALWFYDVSDESSPSLLGWWSPGHHLDPMNAFASCTAHHGRIVPDPEGRDLLAMSFYGAGVVLLDFSDPRMAEALDQIYDGSNTWETWYYNGYLFTGDLNRGMDVLTFE